MDNSNKRENSKDRKQEAHAILDEQGEVRGLALEWLIEAKSGRDEKRKQTFAGPARDTGTREDLVKGLTGVLSTDPTSFILYVVLHGGRSFWPSLLNSSSQLAKRPKVLPEPSGP